VSFVQVFTLKTSLFYHVLLSYSGRYMLHVTIKFCSQFTVAAMYSSVQARHESSSNANKSTESL